MTTLLLARARGLTAQTTAALLVAIVVAVASGRVAVSLRGPADRLLASAVLDSGILIGLCAPIAVATWVLEDRLSWLSVTGCRNMFIVRLRWLTAVTAGVVLTSSSIAWFVPHQQSRLLIGADCVLLFGLGVLGSVACGARLGWAPPAALALLCSTPGLLPLSVNWPVRADHAGAVLVLSIVVTITGAVLYLWLDDYGVARERRLLGRMAGVTDE